MDTARIPKPLAVAANKSQYIRGSGESPTSCGEINARGTGAGVEMLSARRDEFVFDPTWTDIGVLGTDVGIPVVPPSTPPEELVDLAELDVTTRTLRDDPSSSLEECEVIDVELSELDKDEREFALRLIEAYSEALS